MVTNVLIRCISLISIQIHYHYLRTEAIMKRMKITILRNILIYIWTVKRIRLFRYRSIPVMT